ncbi:unnamed protein product, partial [Prorocentrum cordatum]
PLKAPDKDADAQARAREQTLLRAAEEPGGKRRALHAPTALGEALRRAEKRGREGREGGRGREERRGRREVEDQEAALDAVASAIKIPGRGPSAPAPLYTQDSGYKNIHGRCKRVDSTCCPPLGKRDQRQ